MPKKGHIQVKNIGEYHDFYLKTDVMPLLDVFENYRDLGLKTYNVDPAWSFTSPDFLLMLLKKYIKQMVEFFSNTNEHNYMCYSIKKNKKMYTLHLALGLGSQQ